MAKRLFKVSQEDTSRRSKHVIFGSTTYKLGGLCGPRTLHNAYEMRMLLHGEARIISGGQTSLLRVGYVGLSRSAESEVIHFSKTQPTCEWWLLVKVPIIPSPLQAMLRLPPFIRPLTSSIRGLLELGLSSVLREEESYQNYLDQLALAALYEYTMLAGPTTKRIPRFHEAVERARLFISEHYREPLSLTQIAQAASVAPQYLIKLFGDDLGITPIRYLWTVRANRAAQLLEETGLQISEIAEAAGFQNPFHFSRLFKQHHCISPRQFRNRSWEKR